MLENSYDVVVCNPLRPLDCRWKLALQVVRGEASLPGDCEDKAIHLAVEYLRAVDESASVPNTDQPSALKPELAAVQQAHELYATAGPQAWIVEARILARQTPDEIGPLVSLSARVVELFEALFFGVKERLSATVVMNKLAVGMTSAAWFEGCDLRTVLKSFGYCGGSVVLDVAIPALLPSARTWCRNLAPVDDALAAKVRRLAGSMLMPIRNEKDALKMMRLQVQLMETTQLVDAVEEVSLGAIFEEIVRTKVAEMPPNSFKPQPETDAESPEQDNAEASAAIGKVAECEVA